MRKKEDIKKGEKEQNGGQDNLSVVHPMSIHYSKIPFDHDLPVVEFHKFFLPRNRRRRSFHAELFFRHLPFFLFQVLVFFLFSRIFQTPTRRTNEIRQRKAIISVSPLPLPLLHPLSDVIDSFPDFRLSPN